jgi:hypothetical protein
MRGQATAAVIAIALVLGGVDRARQGDDLAVAPGWPDSAKAGPVDRQQARAFTGLKAA